MSDTVSQELFFELVGKFVDEANTLSQQHPPELVATSMMYALARYNTYVVARSARDKDDFTADRQQALDFFTERYQAMFLENFKDHMANYETYMETSR